MIRTPPFCATAFLLVACPGQELPGGDTAPPQELLDTAEERPIDRDADGYPEAEGDCDDTDPDVHPLAEETCNGIDDNCEGRADEGHPDTDGDGIADCMDIEVCDGLDNDGDGEVDEGFDADGDGWAACDECDDTDPTVAPDQPEREETARDEDCDGFVDEGDWAHGDLVVTEMLINPAWTSDPKGEWFEVLNTSEGVIHLDGLSLVTDSETHKVVSDRPLPLSPGERALLGSHGDSRANGGVEPIYVYSGLSLSNEGGSLALLADSTELDTVTWDATVPEGASLTLDPHHLSAVDNDDPQWWCPGLAAWSGSDDLGSPGTDNPLCPVGGPRLRRLHPRGERLRRRGAGHQPGHGGDLVRRRRSGLRRVERRRRRPRWPRPGHPRG